MTRMTEDARQLASENMTLVPYTLRKYFGCTGELDEDTVSDGYIGLCNAASSFNADSGTKFSTYAIHCIRAELMKRYKLSHLASRYPAIPPISLNVRVMDEEGEISELGDLIRDEKADTEGAALSHIFLRGIVSALPIMSAIDVFCYHGIEVAASMGCSRQRVGYLRAKELRDAERTLIRRHIIDRDTIAIRKEGS